jgi:hypothetical protein
MRFPVSRSGRVLIIVLSLLLTGAASAGAIVLAKDSDEGGASASARQDHSAHPIAGNFEPDDTKLADCDDQPCYEQAFGNIAYEDGPKPALALFDQKIASDRAIEAGCHRIAHMIGSAALARYDGNVAKAFAEGSSSCWSGYYHGILEHALAGVTSEQALVARTRALCEDSEIRRTAYIAYQCVHGLGHGLMIHTGYNLPYSLKICDRQTTKWDQTSCTGGVFMENISPSLGGQTRWLKKKDLVYPCNAIKERHKLYCYLMVTSRILQANGYDWKAAARICSGVERGWVSTCFQSYGRDSSGYTRQDPARVLDLCAIAGKGRDDCIYGAARDMTSNYANGQRASQLCGRAPSAVRGHCFFGIGTILGGLHATSQGRRSACGGLTTNYVRQCLRGAGEPA